MRRFFVEPHLLKGSSGIISGELCRHISTVLRLKVGDRLRLADGEGREAVATITAVATEGIRVDLDPCAAAAACGTTPAITVYQGLPKGEKIDLVLQKCTELGAAAIVPFMAERSITRLEGERLEKRVARWQKIALEAARQSGRETVPRIGFAPDMAELLRQDDHDLCLMLWEDEKEQGLRGVLETANRPESIAVLIGPEGGLTPTEVAMATAAGYRPVTLGRRILRTETAGLAVVSILQYVWGDLG
ncbi:MAG TPA: 16S rRNA (uracil(1498)-N(3))-methyltransferase [Geobacteraceae bacterium]|nr:16S rRNA (uracil(1498)-N(3))-methyltransferase [Geobacteraceae bacterium]